MKILQTIMVKQILTASSKEKLLKSWVQKMEQLQKECEQLKFESKKMEKSNKALSVSIHSQYEKEIKSRQEKLKMLDFQIEQLHILPLGSELLEKEVQALVDIHVGDDWDKLEKSTIILKDGIIEEIR